MYNLVLHSFTISMVYQVGHFRLIFSLVIYTLKLRNYSFGRKWFTLSQSNEQSVNHYVQAYTAVRQKPLKLGCSDVVGETRFVVVSKDYLWQRLTIPITYYLNWYFMHVKLCVAFHRLRNILCAVSAESRSPHVREKIKRNNVRDVKRRKVSKVSTGMLIFSFTVSSLITYCPRWERCLQYYWSNQELDKSIWRSRIAFQHFNMSYSYFWYSRGPFKRLYSWIVCLHWF